MHLLQPQDLLIDMFGGPDHVAEMTGRKARMVREGGCFRFRPRASDETPLDLVSATGTYIGKRVSCKRQLRSQAATQAGLHVLLLLQCFSGQQ